MKPHRQQSHVAFSLLEVMVAIAIFAGVLGAIYACWSAVLRGSRSALDAAADVQRGRIAQRTLESALSTAQLFSGNAKFYAFYGETEGNFASLSFVSRLPESFPGAGMFGDLRMRRVSFGVQPGTNNSAQLVMTQMPYLFATNADQQPYSLVLAKSVKLFQVQFWDTNSAAARGRGDGKWVDVWPYTNILPAKVQYEIGIDSGTKAAGAAPYVVTGVVTMPAAANVDTLQRGSGGLGTRQTTRTGQPITIKQ